MFRVFNLRKGKKIVIILIGLAMAAIGAVIGFKSYFPLKYVDLIYMYSLEYNVPAEVVCAIINAESSFDVKAKSGKGACGLMQIMQQTADWAAEEINIENYNYSRIYEPELNIRIGCWYMGRLLKQYENNLNTALAAYNAGSGNVSKWLKNTEYSPDSITLETIPFAETEKYIKKINSYTKVYEFLLSNK